MKQVTVTYASGEKVAYPAGVKAQDVIGKMEAWPGPSPPCSSTTSSRASMPSS